MSSIVIKPQWLKSVLANQNPQELPWGWVNPLWHGNAIWHKISPLLNCYHLMLKPCMAHGPNPFFMVSIIALVNLFCGIFHDILSFIFLLISTVHLMSETLHLFMHHVHFKSTPSLLCILQALNWNDSNKHVILSENVSQTCDNTSYSCFMLLYCHVCLSIP